MSAWTNSHPELRGRLPTIRGRTCWRPESLLLTVYTKLREMINSGLWMVYRVKKMLVVWCFVEVLKWDGKDLISAVIP